MLAWGAGHWGHRDTRPSRNNLQAVAAVWMWGKVGLSGPHREPRWEASGKSSPSLPFPEELSRPGTAEAGPSGWGLQHTLRSGLSWGPWLPRVPASRPPPKAAPSFHPSSHPACERRDVLPVNPLLDPGSVSVAGETKPGLVWREAAMAPTSEAWEPEGSRDPAEQG